MTDASAITARLPRCGEDAVLSFSGVVKAWECDRNDHWNLQYYVRAFQSASETLAAVTGGTNPGAASALMRHYRFHGELFCPDPMRIRSSRVLGGAYDGMILHWMEAVPEDRLVATAIEAPNYPVQALPSRVADGITPAMPRGIAPGAHVWDGGLFGGSEDTLHVAALGIIRGVDADHREDVNAGELASRVAAASHHLLARTGFTSEWIDRTNCNRMAVEMKITRHGPCRIGERLEAVSWISATPGARTFSTMHQLVNASTGAPCATVEHLMLVVDLGTRRPVIVPDLLVQAARGGRSTSPRRQDDGGPA